MHLLLIKFILISVWYLNKQNHRHRQQKGDYQRERIWGEDEECKVDQYMVAEGD